MDDLSLLRIEFNPKELPAVTDAHDDKLKALRQRAEELSADGKYNEAADVLVQVYDMRPQDIEICYLIAQNLRREKKIKAALQWAERAVLRDGHNLQYLLLAAELNIMVRRAGKAQGYLRRVLDLEPEHQRAAKLETMILQ